MRTMSFQSAILLIAAGAASLFSVLESHGQASPFRGLWVGSANLRAVNEVTIPLDENNVPIAPDPQVPTATFDEANIRIIVHVNGAGQAFLLKDVAILNRAESTNEPDADVFANETDLALVTDPRIYSEYPPQPAKRIASAMFDFGDQLATEALDALVEKAAEIATAYAVQPGLVLNTQAQKINARNSASAIIITNLEPIAANADVSESFSQFLSQFDSATLDAIAADIGSPLVASNIALATQLRDQSFYQDSRALDMVNAVVQAISNAPLAEREAAAHNTASSYADVLNLYQRFISGKVFGDMIHAAAEEAADAALLPGATESSIDTAMRGTAEAIAAITESINAKVAFYDDTRSADAVDAVLEAMAAAALANNNLPASDIEQLSKEAGRSVLSDMVARYPLPLMTPTIDYDAFVTSVEFAGVAQTASDAAAEGAITERAGNVLWSTNSIFASAKIAALNALQSVYSIAARAMRTELPLEGVFAPGSGDPTPIATLTQPGDLGAPGLTGRIYLPANHPTNPFRHRRHPDHTTGYNIERMIRFDFDGEDGDEPIAAGYGVDQVSGTYREEIFGLHKPLGPDPVNSPIGLKTEGHFELNRISFIDTLNTR